MCKWLGSTRISRDSKKTNLSKSYNEQGFVESHDHQHPKVILQKEDVKLELENFGHALWSVIRSVIVSGRISKKNIYLCGVLLYIQLEGFFPFSGRNIGKSIPMFNFKMHTELLRWGTLSNLFHRINKISSTGILLNSLTIEMVCIYTK